MIFSERTAVAIIFLLSFALQQTFFSTEATHNSFSFCVTKQLNNEPVLYLQPDYSIRCSFPPSYNIRLVAPLYQNTAAAIIQFHTMHGPLTLISLNELNMNESASGNHVGMVTYPTLSERNSTWLLVSDHVGNTSIEVLIMIRNLDKYDPVPGACNQEFVLENDPNIQFSANPTYDLSKVEFAPSNVGVDKGGIPPICDEKNSPRFGLEYDIYVMYFSVKEVTNMTFFTAVNDMLRVEDIIMKSCFVKTVSRVELTEVYLATYKGRGIAYNVVVRDPVTNLSEAYVPFMDYACDFRNGSVCLFTDIGPTMIYTFSALIGIILCFFGHWIFMFETFMFGFLPSSIGFYMIFAVGSPLPPYGIMTLAVTVALISGFAFMTLWWRFAFVIPTVLWISLCLGFLISASIFFTPFGNLSVWRNNTAFGLAFMCGVLLVPVFGLPLPKWLSYAACSIVGSYMTISALSFSFGGILQYIVLNIIHRAYITNFEKAMFVMPIRAVDYGFAVIWILMAICGFLVQWKLNKDLPDFPTHPYKRWRAVRAERRFFAQRAPESQDQITSGTVSTIRRTFDEVEGVENDVSGTIGVVTCTINSDGDDMERLIDKD